MYGGRRHTGHPNMVPPGRKGRQDEKPLDLSPYTAQNNVKIKVVSLMLMLKLDPFIDKMLHLKNSRIYYRVFVGIKSPMSLVANENSMY